VHFSKSFFSGGTINILWYGSQFRSLAILMASKENFYAFHFY
jgi:hypothetical protein